MMTQHWWRFALWNSKSCHQSQWRKFRQPPDSNLQNLRNLQNLQNFCKLKIDFNNIIIDRTNIRFIFKSGYILQYISMYIILKPGTALKVLTIAICGTWKVSFFIGYNRPGKIKFRNSVVKCVFRLSDTNLINSDLEI